MLISYQLYNYTHGFLIDQAFKDLVDMNSNIKEGSMKFKEKFAEISRTVLTFFLFLLNYVQKYKYNTVLKIFLGV